MEKRIDLPRTITVRGLLNLGSRYLARNGVVNHLGESEIFLAHLLNCPRMELYLDNMAVARERKDLFLHLLTARAGGFPMQYLLGSTEFMGLEFKVARGVFIPRPETEILVETIINILPDEPTILDIGTGCGNIAVSLAKYLKGAHIFACDISDSALQLAKENSSSNKARVFLVKSNLFCAFKKENYFSLIVSNPPYISASQFCGLAREVHYEPKVALGAGVDGLFYYRKIINEAPTYLQDRGKLCLEIGDNQAAAVEGMLKQGGRFSLLEVVKDYNGAERVIVAQKTG